MVGLVVFAGRATARRVPSFAVKSSTSLLAALAAVLLTAAPATAAPTAKHHDGENWSFVTRSGPQLMLDGKPWRFAGANIEWLGLVGYGPLNFEPGHSMRFPTEYEVDDALATAKEMGATVVRAQTLGDTAGCPNCLEPSLGHWNPEAFRVMDYAIMRARHYGIRLILEFQGDSRGLNGGNTSSVFSGWEGGSSFWTNATVINDFEADIEHIVDHVNSYTGVPYKEDPTILGWMDCNECSVSGAGDSWVTTIADYVASLHPKNLIFSNAPSVTPDTTELADPNIDAFTAEVYPHWVPGGAGERVSGEDPWIHAAAKLVTTEGKVWFAAEDGWDPTDWLTTTSLQNFLTGIEQDPNVSGDLWWAMEGHANGHGWTPVPGDSHCFPSLDNGAPPSGWSAPPATPAGGAGCQAGEDGSWWAMYYTGIDTASNTASDMAARAQMLRTHAYAMQGRPVPAHMPAPAPIITQTSDGKLYWEGSAGAKDYSIEAAPGSSGPWTTACDQCVTDSSDGWKESDPSACYRVVPYNLDNKPGEVSPPAGGPCGELSGTGSGSGGGPGGGGGGGSCTSVPPVPHIATSGLASAYNNIGISSNCTGAGDFDLAGDSFSMEGLAARGFAPGTVTWGGMNFDFPSVSTGQPDNVIAEGQTVTLSPPPGATALGVLASASFGPVPASATITYTDGTTQTVDFGFSDWTLGAGANQLAYGEQVAAMLPSRNNVGGGSAQVLTYLFGKRIALLPGKTAASITLPQPVGAGPDGVGMIHVFAFGFGT